MKKKIVFLDWDGTLSHGRFWSGLDKESYENIQNLLFAKNESPADQWMKGEKTSEEVCAWLEGITGHTSSLLMDELSKSCEQMTLSDVTLHLISELRKNAYLVLITDNMDCFSRFTVPANQLQTVFDRIINSSDIARSKRDQDGLSFRETAEQYGLQLSNSILIDDSEKTCNLFQQMGGAIYQTKA